MDPSRLNNLLFLLAATSVGCLSGDGHRDRDGSPRTSTATSTPTSTVAATPGSSGDTGGRAGGSQATADATGSDTGSGTDGIAACDAYETQLAGCFYDRGYGGCPHCAPRHAGPTTGMGRAGLSANEGPGAGVAPNCTEIRSDLELYYGAACGASFEEFVACLATADCAAIEAGTACPDEDAAALADCD